VFKKIITAVVCAAGLLHAQPQTVQQSEITAFAKAMVAIEQLNKKLRQEVSQIRGERAVQQKIEQVQKEFKQKSTQIVLEHGFDKERYLEYAKKFQKNEAFKKKVLEAVSEVE
jgi:hypothetical protein